MMWQPPEFTHEQRLTKALAITEALKRRFGNRLVAVMLEGSVAKGLDVPCSDLELAVLIESAEDRWYPFVDRRGMFVGVSYKAPETQMADAAKIDYTWPVAGDSLLHGTVLYDPGGFYPKLREVSRQAEAAADFNLLVRDALADMYENVLKLFALRPEHGHEAVVFAGQIAYWAAITIALASKHRYLSTRRMIEESFTLPSLPAGFREDVTALLSAGGDLPRCWIALGRLWPGMLKWAATLGVRLDDDGAML